MLIPKSSIPLIHWPAVPDIAGALLFSILHQLEESQWWSNEEIHKHQFKQLTRLLTHAQTTVPYYHKSFSTAQIVIENKLTEEIWSQIPIWSRNEFKNNAKSFLSKSPLKEHGKVVGRQTSGSMGEPLQFLKTEITELFWCALTMRDHLWQGHDLSQKLFAIHSGHYTKDPLAIIELPGWDKASNMLFNTGPCTLIFNQTPIAQQFKEIVLRQPQYLLIFPNNLLSLMQYCSETEQSLPAIKQITTYGETLSPSIRQACHDNISTSIDHLYSCEEAGYIALQCPEHEHHHIQSESVLVEILNDENQPCQPGEIGRVVLTSLYNFATPFIRYDIGDYAEVGGPCPCGRGLPVLNRILGKGQHSIILPNGKRHWPDLPKIIIELTLPIKQLQVIQKDKININVNAVAKRQLDPTEQKLLDRHIQKELGDAFTYTYNYFDEISRHLNGKFEYVINEMSINKENTA